MICLGGRACASTNGSTSRFLIAIGCGWPMIARRFKLAQLQVERRLAGHRRAILAPRRKLVRQHRHQRIVAQFVVVVETPLPQPGLHRFQNQSVLRYTMSASELLPSIAKSLQPNGFR